MIETTCDCCACLAGAHVTEVTNRPGLPAIRYRVGNYASFYDAMIRRLTVPVDPGQVATYSLHRLTTREHDDMAIALLDAWAIVADVLTFYQERIANEAFLRTALERRSVLELGRLVGYALKPGVSASVYLAYTLDETATTIIPGGTKAQSIPGPNEQPQMFETIEDTEARGAWNALRPRMSRPQPITIENVLTIPSLWIEGTTTRLEQGDPLLFVFDTGRLRMFAVRRTLNTIVDAEHKRTEIVLEHVRPYYVALAQAVLVKLPRKEPPKPGQPPVALEQPTKPIERFFQQILLGASRDRLVAFANDKNNKKELGEKIVDVANRPDVDAPTTIEQDGPVSPGEIAAPLLKSPGLAPATPWSFNRSLERSLEKRSDYVPRLLATFFPQLRRTIYTALANNESGARPYAQFRGVHVFRRRAAVFGYNAPTILFEDRPSVPPGEHLAAVVQPPVPAYVDERDNILYLDTPDAAVTVDSYVMTRNHDAIAVAKVVDAKTQPRTAYGISGQSTRLTLGADWAAFAKKPDKDEVDKRLKAMIANLEHIRETAVLAESEELTLAQRPVDRPIGRKAGGGVTAGESETRIELDGVVDGLAPGRWVIVAGERLDTHGTNGIVSAELAMVDAVEQHTIAEPGGRSFSLLTLAPAGLAYEYTRDTVKILGNVVKANHGETRSEILGGGDASKSSQSFTLHQSPLTFVSAPTVDGVQSTLAVRVNDVLWHEVATLAGAAPHDRVFVTKTADDGKVSVLFGNGRAGERPPTGADNIRSIYRSGIGQAANVRAGQIATAISRPLGVRDVVNPLAASGGADPESRDDARRNIPVSLQAMGRVVSVGDYADFARTFAGISKAVAAALSDGRRRVVHLTIGGAGDIEIDATSDLHRNLTEALRKYGDPYQPFTVAMRDKIVIAGAARVRVLPDYLWTNVGPAVRAALVDVFSYDRREFGQPVYPAEVVTAIQSVAGVAYVDLDALGGIRSSHLFPEPHLPRIDSVNAILPQLAHRGHHVLQPAQIAYLPPELADLFILSEIVHD